MARTRPAFFCRPPCKGFCPPAVLPTRASRHIATSPCIAVTKSNKGGPNCLQHSAKWNKVTKNNLATVAKKLHTLAGIAHQPCFSRVLYFLATRIFSEPFISTFLFPYQGDIFLLSRGIAHIVNFHGAQLMFDGWPLWWAGWVVSHTPLGLKP